MRLLAVIRRLVSRRADRAGPATPRGGEDPSCCQPVVRGVRVLQQRQRQQQGTRQDHRPAGNR